MLSQSNTKHVLGFRSFNPAILALHGPRICWLALLSWPAVPFDGHSMGISQNGHSSPAHKFGWHHITAIWWLNHSLTGRNYQYRRIFFAFIALLYLLLDWTYCCWNWKIKTENWKYCNKIIFKYVNSIVGPIFNEKLLKSRIYGSVNSTQIHCL